MSRPRDPLKLEKLSIMVGTNEIRRLKYLAVDQKRSASEIIRSVLRDYFEKDQLTAGSSKQKNVA